jgi:hypothetical protein
MKPSLQRYLGSLGQLAVEACRQSLLASDALQGKPIPSRKGSFRKDTRIVGIRAEAFFQLSPVAENCNARSS